MPDDHALIKAAHPRQRLRHAIEVRHESFRTREFYELLRRHKIALVVADNPGQWPIITEITTDLMYVRLHGHDQLYASGYSDSRTGRVGGQDHIVDRAGLRRVRLLRQRYEGTRPVRRNGPDGPLRPCSSTIRTSLRTRPRIEGLKSLTLAFSWPCDAPYGLSSGRGEVFGGLVGVEGRMSVKRRRAR